MRSDAAANRKRILAAADDVFAEHGPHAPTGEVARQAGVGIGTVFRHFPTKSALVEAALVARLDELVAQAAELASSGDSAAALEAVLRETVRTGRVTMALTRHLLAEAPELPEGAAAASARLHDVVADLLRAAQDAGVVRRDIDADEVWFLLHGLSQAQDTVPAADAVRRRALDVVLDGLAAPSPPSQPGRRTR